MNAVLKAAAATALLVLSACQQEADIASTPEEFYRGKTVTIVVGYTPGGGYDEVARSIARFMPKYLPGNPSVIVQNMPGAGGLVAANYLYNNAPADGTFMGLLADTVPLSPLWRPDAARYDSRRISWIGSIGPRGTPMVLVRKDAPAVTVEQARKTEVLIGSTGPDSVTSAYARMVNDMLGTKLNVIIGYAGGSEIMLAIERGEVHGRTGYDWGTVKREYPHWIEKDFVTVMVQLALKPNPELSYAPTIYDLVDDEEDRQVLELVLGTGDFARVLSAPPDVPADRLAVLREALKKTFDDPEFRADVATRTPVLHYAPPEEIEAFVLKAYSTPREILDRARDFVGAE